MDASGDPLVGAERSEALEFAASTLLERLSPTERAAYVLREAFEYPYGRIAAIVGVKEQNARQLVSRARKHLAVESACRKAVNDAEQKRLFQAFVAAAQGDLRPLETVFAKNTVGTGGIAMAA